MVAVSSTDIRPADRCLRLGMTLFAADHRHHFAVSGYDQFTINPAEHVLSKRKEKESKACQSQLLLVVFR